MAGSNLAEFRRRVFLNLKKNDGETNLAFERAINDAIRTIARVKDLDEMFVLDTANCKTAANTGEYIIGANGFGLTTLKDIYSIRYIDGANNSRKLLYISPRELDLLYPYKLAVTQGIPRYYTRRGGNVEVLPVPSANQANKELHVYYSKWPTALSNDSDAVEYENLDDVVTVLATEMTAAYCEGQGAATDWTSRAAQLLQIAINERDYRPDNTWTAQPFNPYQSAPSGNAVENPWVKKV